MHLKELQVLCDRKFDLGMYTPALVFLLRKKCYIWSISDVQPDFGGVIDEEHT